MLIDSTLSFASMHNIDMLDYAVYPSQDIVSMIANGLIISDVPITEKQVQPASLDLRVGNIGFELTTSFLPGNGETVLSKLSKYNLCIKTLDFSNGPIILYPGHVYLLEVQESLDLPSHIWAKANPRSTTGRADLFTRLLCDYSTEFESIPAGYKGKLYIEVVPRTFAIQIETGSRLNQIRLVDGKLDGKKSLNSIDFSLIEGISRSILTMDLTSDNNTNTVGYRARRNAPVLIFDGIGVHDKHDFWEPILLDNIGNLIIQPDDFYILKSQELISIPPTFAAELTPYDSAFGEFRVHYAGFLDPGFGLNNFSKGTPVVLEVRARDVPFLIEHGQKVAWIIYYPLVKPTEKLYGTSIGSSYGSQGISLGKQFRDL